MPISTMPCGGLDIQYAAQLALHGPVPESFSVDRLRSSIYLLNFAQPVPDRRGRGGYSHGLLFLLRGQLGRYAEVTTLVAADSAGTPLADEPDPLGGPGWIRLLDGQTHLNPSNATAFASRYGLPV
jgi:hypothetical protein